ncbi:MAG TPA: CoA transferase [Dehalococcoidia bacterium]|nr:CoA transferase [Dehalococcoidia bacterium]
MAEGALAGLRVLECGELVAAPFAAKILGQLGADVVKLEPPAGDSLRRRGPFPAGKEGAETGGLHLFLDQAKRSVVLDLETAAGQAQLRRLAAGADILIASGSPALLERRGLSDTALRAANPRLIVTLITPFGLAVTEDRELPVRPLPDLAASGWLSISPGALDNASLPPLAPFGQQAHYQAGLHAVIATLGALLARDGGAGGQLIDISTQAAIASQLESGLMHYLYNNRVASRLGTRIVGPWGMVQLADGLFFLLTVTEDEWKRLLDFLGNPEWAESPLFADRLVRAENNDALLGLLESEMAGRGVAETYAAMQARRIPCTPVNDMAALLRNDHLNARGAFVQLDHPDAGTLTYPGAPWQLGLTPWQPGRRAPRLSEHSEEVLREAEGSGSEVESKAEAAAPTLSPVTSNLLPSSRPPLAGVRVADFTWVWAGPVATLQLAHLGADVIKIESAGRLDTVRSLPPMWQEERGINRSGYFNQYNQGKRSIALNLKQPEAMELAYELVRRSDVVADNFSAGVMERMGLGYEKLKQIKPDIIQISLAGHGQTGPIAKYVAYGPTQVPMIGLMSLTGYPGGIPREVGISYGDPNGGLNAALAVLAALHHRQRSGQGQCIDMSQWEAALPLVAEGLLAYQVEGRQPERQGNRDAFEAPQGVYRCAGPGDDAWLALACWSDGEWQALARAIGRADLAAAPSLANRAGRKAREDEIDAAITAWTQAREAEAAATALRAAGVAAQAVATTRDVSADARLAERDFWVELPHPECSGARHAGIPWQLGGTPLAVQRSAPTLGQHTDEVLAGVLGLSAARIAALHAAGALE